ncbi:MAG: hypothetical protein CSB13_12125 [Chloroflexi bacterium]|nr:MAG: hypothetical protein CSB13_12125 [Chloroflexota bacterium]
MMKKTPFIWLGANRARKWPVGQKALLLDQAASAGLPVPNGAILLDELFQLFLQEGVIAMQETAVTHAHPQWLFESLYDGIRFPRVNKPTMLRGAFSAPAQDHKSVHTPAVLDVDMHDPHELARAFSRIWSVSPPPNLDFRRDVIVMEMVQGEIRGSVVTNAEDETDHLSIQDEVSELPRLASFFGRTDSRLPPYAQRLQKLLRGIRRTFGKGAWQVDWVDDGEICWVTKVAA